MTRPHDTLEKTVIFLNRGGIGPGVSSLKHGSFHFYYDGLHEQSIKRLGRVVLRIDPENPQAMIQENRQPRVAVICTQTPAFELSREWFHAQLKKAIRHKPVDLSLEDNGADLAAGEVICHAVKSLLDHLGRELSDGPEDSGVVSKLSVPGSGRCFHIPSNSDEECHTVSVPLSSSDGRNPEETDHLVASRMLRVWWFSFGWLLKGMDRARMHKRLSQELEASSLTALKLRAHLALALLEAEPQAVGLPLAIGLHSSVLDWLEANLETPVVNYRVQPSQRRYDELGDVLFETAPWFNFSNHGDWRSARKIRPRQAVRQIDSLCQPDTPERVKRKSLVRLLPRWRRQRKGRQTKNQPFRNLLERYVDTLGRAEEFFSKRYDVRELIATGRAWDRVRRCLSKQHEGHRALALVRSLRGVARHLPWPYIFFTFLALSGWGLWAANSTLSLPIAHYVKVVYSVIFSLLYVAFYALLVFFVLVPLSVKQRLFSQFMPRITGSLIIGYTPLWLSQETWTFPFYLGWGPILGCTSVVLSVAYVYFVLEISSIVHKRSAAIQKATVVFLIAAAQAYGLGLLITDFLARHFSPLLPSMMYESMEAQTLQEYLSQSGELILVKNPLGMLEGFFAGNLSLPTWSQPILSFEFWFLPKLVVTWFGLSMFISVFVHMIWQKEGTLDRVFGRT